MQSPSQTDNSIFSGNTFLIAVILTIIFLSLIGLNIFFILEVIFNFFKNIFLYILSFFSYVTGFVIFETADVVKNGALVTVDVAGDAVEDVGKLMMDASKQNIKVKLDDSLRKKENFANYSEDSTDNPIQNNIKNNNKYTTFNAKDSYITCPFDPTSAMCLNTKSN